MLVVGTNMNGITNLKAHMGRDYKMKDLGVVNQICGTTIFRNISNEKV